MAAAAMLDLLSAYLDPHEEYLVKFYKVLQGWLSLQYTTETAKGVIT